MNKKSNEKVRSLEKLMFDPQEYLIVLDFDGTLVSTNNYFKKYENFFKLVSAFYFLYKSLFKELISYKKIRKILNKFTEVASRGVCNEYLKNKSLKNEISLLIHYLDEFKRKEFSTLILSQSKTIECLGLLNLLLGHFKIPYFWVAKEKKSYLEIICKEKKCVLISDREDKNIVEKIKNLIFIRVNNPYETYKILNKIMKKKDYNL